VTQFIKGKRSHEIPSGVSFFEFLKTKGPADKPYPYDMVIPKLVFSSETPSWPPSEKFSKSMLTLHHPGYEKTTAESSNLKFGHETFADSLSACAAVFAM